MMRALDTLVARLLLLSVVGITLVHALSLWTFERALQQELTQAQLHGLADRLISIRQSLVLVPEPQREELAHGLSGGVIEAHWNRSRGAAPGGPGAEAWQSLAHQIRLSARDLQDRDIVIGTSTDQHVALLSLRLPDETWLNVNLFTLGRVSASGHGTLLSTSLMAVGVALLSLLLARWLTRPLRRMSEAVAELTPDKPMKAVQEVGPREVRQLATAFNDMQTRIADLIRRRTGSLAAVSHDLRTPLTRLKLRLTDVPDRELRRTMSADIDEMEQMIDATLSYLRGDERAEPARPIDLVAVLDTIINDARDMGGDATLRAPQHLVIQARLVGLRRALSNLVVNALRFGTQVRASVETTTDHVVVIIDDNGPGLAEDKLAVVMEPFVRLEGSRNMETGGVGLGLTIAKANIEADGGTLLLRNRPEGGLSAVVCLPRPAP